MHRANLVERELRRPGFSQTKSAKRVVPASRLPNRDPTATSAKRPRRNARRSTALGANERGQRNAKPAQNADRADVPRATAARLRSDDSLVANPTRPRINQLERRLDDAPKRRAFPVRLCFRSRFQYSFPHSFAPTRPAPPPRFTVHCTQKTPRRKRPNGINRPFDEKNAKRKISSELFAPSQRRQFRL